MTIKITELQVKTRTKLFNVQFRFLFVTTEVPLGTTVRVTSESHDYSHACHATFLSLTKLTTTTTTTTTANKRIG